MKKKKGKVTKKKEMQPKAESTLKGAALKKAKKY